MIDFNTYLREIEKAFQSNLATRQQKADRKYLSGSRGGYFYLNSSGRKTYFDKKFCGDR